MHTFYFKYLVFIYFGRERSWRQIGVFYFMFFLVFHKLFSASWLLDHFCIEIYSLKQWVYFYSSTEASVEIDSLFEGVDFYTKITRAIRRLRTACERAKRTLSSRLFLYRNLLPQTMSLFLHSPLYYLIMFFLLFHKLFQKEHYQVVQRQV
jgi:hypothetical protein